MDSMKSLNTSLPRSYPRRQPPPGLHQAFRAAALSVAQLYKTAAADEDQARTAGYQDALEELLSFLDQENLGVGDGEGWRVRQWVTERLSPDAYGSGDEDIENRSEQAVSPKSRKKSETRDLRRTSENNRTRSSSAPAIELSQPPQQEPPQSQNDQRVAERSSAFHFRSPLQLPEDTTMVNSDKPSNRTPNSRHARSRSTIHGSREGTSAAAITALGFGAGSKRRAQSGDIFDFGIFDSIRDPNGGGKRGRFT